MCVGARHAVPLLRRYRFFVAFFTAAFLPVPHFAMMCLR